MILARLEITDYKQFAGTHEFEPSADGIVAIIGQNGAGKTTLFEAIEWCLYQPREIALDEVPPRGQAAKPRVTLTMADPVTGVRYVISRWLSRSRTADAEIYREDDPENRIVKGARASTDYITNTLIGLGHRAFVSTFFTRQKELTFFGDLKETDRRREVGRLLGMETIRDAQKAIGDERTERQQAARALTLQHQEAISGRDFEAERVAADLRVTEGEKAANAAAEALTAAEAAHLRAREAVEQLASQERADAAIRQRILQLDGQLSAQLARQEASVNSLARIDDFAARRPPLAVLAADLPARKNRLQRLELDRERFQRYERLQQESRRARSRIQEQITQAAGIVRKSQSAFRPDWQWREVAGDDAVSQAAGLAQLAGSIDLTALEARIADLEALLRLTAEAENDSAQLVKFRAFREKLERELAEALQETNPAIGERLNQERQTTERNMHVAGSRLQAIAAEVAKLQPVKDRLAAQEAGTTCPTCGRPIVAADMAVAIELFAAQLQALADERRAIDQSIPRYKATLDDLSVQITAYTSGQERVTLLKERVANGAQKITETEEALAKREVELGRLRSRIGKDKPISQDAVEKLRSEVGALRQISHAGGVLAQITRELRQLLADATESDAAIRELGEVSYNESAHQSASQQVMEADRAIAEVARIDAEIANRPAAEADLHSTQTEIATLSATRENARTEQRDLAFDPAALEMASQEANLAMQAERTARDDASRLATALLQARTAREHMLAEQTRIQRLVARADQATREAGELDLMYKEFNLFEQFVAEQLTPQLSDYTSELVRSITEGKYDQVQFTSNYGIEVFDGDVERFPVEEFSGGERDVIALSARLALSRLIGSRANNPPGFMVLDEVFGSLDRERRAHVLETLATLAGTADAFRQLFIISHVDDVRFSPVFNEIWRVSEGPDGISRLENLNLSRGFEES